MFNGVFNFGMREEFDCLFDGVLERFERISVKCELDVVRNYFCCADIVG